MPILDWRKSSYCQSGDACMHAAAYDGTILLTESADPNHATLRTTTDTWKALLDALMQSHRTSGRPVA